MNLKQLSGKSARKIKDGNWNTKKSSKQEIWSDLQYQAKVMLKNTKGGTNYDIHFWGFLEDGVPLTYEVYSNDDSKWSESVYIKSEKEEMMLNAMQNYGGYLTFNGEDAIDEGRVAGSMSLKQFFDFWCENVIPYRISDSRRVKDDKIEPFYYNFGESGRYDEDYEMYDEDHDIADYLMNEADLLENKYSVYEKGGDTVENWEQCIRGYFDLVDKTNVTDVDAVFHILEDANFHLLNWVLLLEKGTDKDVQYAIDFIFDDTDGFIQRNQRYVALRNVINEMGIA